MKIDSNDIRRTLSLADAVKELYVESSEEDAEPGMCGMKSPFTGLGIPPRIGDRLA